MNIIPFSFDGAPVRCVTLGSGEPGFVAKDVAERLGYVDTVNAIKQHCKGVVIRHPLQTEGGTQEMRILTEPDVLRLILSSKLPAAERFERWVFEEVLPAIRKTGAYAVPMAAAPTGDELKLSLLESAVRRGLVSAPAAESAALRIIGVDTEHVSPAPKHEPVTTPIRVAAIDTKVTARRTSRASLFALKPSLTLSSYGKNRTALPTLRVSLEEAAEWIDEGQVVMLVVMFDKGYIDANRAPTAKARNLHDKHGWKLKSLLSALGLPV